MYAEKYIIWLVSKNIYSSRNYVIESLRCTLSLHVIRLGFYQPKCLKVRGYWVQEVVVKIFFIVIETPLGWVDIGCVFRWF